MFSAGSRCRPGLNGEGADDFDGAGVLGAGAGAITSRMGSVACTGATDAIARFVDTECLPSFMAAPKKAATESHSRGDWFTIGKREP